MNPPPQVGQNNLFWLHFYSFEPSTQIGSRVRWWNSKGQVMQGTVSAINVLSDVCPWTDYSLCSY